MNKSIALEDNCFILFQEKQPKGSAGKGARRTVSRPGSAPPMSPALKKAMSKDDKKKSATKGAKDDIDVEPEIDDVKESVELAEASVKITYKNPKDGKTHSMQVFTAQDAARAEKDLRKQGMQIVKKEMAEDKTPDGVDNNGFDNDKNEYIT